MKLTSMRLSKRNQEKKKETRKQKKRVHMILIYKVKEQAKLKVTEVRIIVATSVGKEY